MYEEIREVIIEVLLLQLSILLTGNSVILVIALVVMNFDLIYEPDLLSLLSLGFSTGFLLFIIYQGFRLIHRILQKWSTESPN